jgi:hypothetical protein
VFIIIIIIIIIIICSSSSSSSGSSYSSSSSSSNGSSSSSSSSGCSSSSSKELSKSMLYIGYNTFFKYDLKISRCRHVCSCSLGENFAWMYVVTLTVRRRPKFRLPCSIDLLVTAGHQTETKTVAPASHVFMSTMLALRTVGIGTYSMKELPCRGTYAE